MTPNKNRQPDETNQSFQESEYVPETHSYQEKHFQPALNSSVQETDAYNEFGSTVTPDPEEPNIQKHRRSDVVETSDQPGENDVLETEHGRNESRRELQNYINGTENSFSGTESAFGTTSAASTASAASSMATASVASVAVTAAAAVIIAAAVIMPMLAAPQLITFGDIVVTDTSVHYTVYIEDYEEGMDLTVSLHNNFTNREHKVESAFTEFTERGLKSGMDYKLTLYGEMSLVLKETTVTTEKTHRVTPELNVSRAEFSTEDGLVHISASLSDPEHICSDFEARIYIETPDGRIPAVTMAIPNFDSELALSTGLGPDESASGTFAIECLQNGETVTLYEKNMSACGIPFIGLASPISVVDHTMTAECLIVDPSGSRTNYRAILNVTDPTGVHGGYQLNAAMVDGRFVFTNVDTEPDSGTTYAFFDAVLTVMFTQDGEQGSRQVGSYSSYSSPALSAKLEDMRIIPSVSSTTDGKDLYIALGVVDAGGEWNELKAVVSGTGEGGGPLSSETAFSRNDTSVLVPIPDQLSGCEDATVSIMNGTRQIVVYSHVSLVPLMDLVSSSYSADTGNGTVVIDIEDTFSQWFDPNGTWIGENSEKPAVTPQDGPQGNKIYGTVSRTGNRCTIDFHLPTVYTSLSTDFTIGQYSVPVTFYSYEMDSYFVTRTPHLSGSFNVTDRDDVLTASDITVTFGGSPMNVESVYEGEEDNVKVVKITLSESQLDTPGLLVLSLLNHDSLRYEQVCQDTATFATPASLDVSSAQFSRDDGRIHISAVLNDPNGLCSDIEAVIYDGADIVATIPIEDFDSELVLNAGLDPDSHVTGILAIECRECGNTVTLYETDIEVFGTPYFGTLETPSIINNAMTVECLIIDPDGLRSGYSAILDISDATGRTDGFRLETVMSDGTFSFQNLNTDPEMRVFTFYDAVLTISYIEDGITRNILFESCPSYASPDMSVDPNDVRIIYSPETADADHILNIQISIVDTEGEWEGLKAVLSGTKADGTPVESEAPFTGNSPGVSIPIPYDLDGCTDATITFTNSSGDILEQFGISLVPTMTFVSNSYDAGSSTATIVVDISDPYERWFRDNEWADIPQERPALNPGASPEDKIYGTVSRTGNRITVSVILPEEYTNLPLPFTMGRSSLGENVTNLRFCNCAISVNDTAAYGASETLGIVRISAPNNPITASNVRIGFQNTYLEIVGVENGPTERDRDVTFRLNENMLNLEASALTVSVEYPDTSEYVTVCTGNVQFLYPAGLSLSYTENNGTEGWTASILVDTKGLADANNLPVMTSVNGTEINVTGTADGGSTGIYKFVYSTAECPDSVSATMKIGSYMGVREYLVKVTTDDIGMIADD